MSIEMSRRQGRHAVVMGGSMTGLLASRVLLESFERVTLVERDGYAGNTDPRKGVPQARHIHGLLARGYDIIRGLFPDFEARLEENGVTPRDMGVAFKMYQFGAYRVPTETGMLGISSSRPLLDLCIRQALSAEPRMTILERHRVEGLIATADRERVTGVTVCANDEGAAPYAMETDLVVDATGRGSQSPKWLDSLGYDRAPESTVKVDVGYASRIYHRSIPDDDAIMYLIWSTPPDKRVGGAFPIEGNRWVVSLGGSCGDHPPLDEEGFRAYARTLPTPEVAQIIESETALTELVPHRFPSNFRRHYEFLKRFPGGYLVMGDAMCSFNPIYGQGMTTAALEAEELRALLRESSGLEGIAPRFFKRAAKHVDLAWQLATGEDFRYAEVPGKRPPGTGFIHAYLERVHRATHADPAVHVAFLKVMNMQAPPTSLFHPSVLGRVLKHAWARPKAPVATAHPEAPRRVASV